MNTKLTYHLLAALLGVVFTAELVAQPTAFTYQGRLTGNGSPASGIYDFQFVIYNGPDSGAPGISALLSAEVMDVPVSNGLFTAEIPFQSWVLNGEPRWLEVQVRTNDAGDYTALVPWAEITPTPYAVRALNVTSNALMGEYGEAVSFSNPANVFVGDGSGLTGVTLDGATVADFWQLAGNAGTTAGTHFLGTTDNQALELKVNNTRALRIENTFTTPNIVGGYSGNSVGAGADGSIIAGGGASGGAENTIGANAIYGAIGGGRNNHIASDSPIATISGGDLNDISDYSDWSAIGGGYDNNISSESWSSTIAGGDLNDIGVIARYSAIGGGYDNNISNNTVYGTIAGGRGNDLGLAAGYSAIGGGYENNIGSNSPSATIAGGEFNDISGNAVGSAIGGGRDNNIGSNSPTATIAGGWFNDVGVEASESVIGGGYDNNIGSGSAAAVIAGGDLNDIGAEADWSAIGGGEDNNIADNAPHATIAGGSGNDIGIGSHHGWIGGGYTNNVSSNAPYAAIPGGCGNTVGEGATNAFAFGHRAHATNAGAFVWADLTDADFSSDRANQFKVRAGGGMYLQAGSSGLTPAALRVECTGATGVAIHANQTSSDSTTVFANRGTGDLIKGFSGPSGNNLVFRVDNAGDVYAQSYNPLSDRNAKENFVVIDPSVVLEKIAGLPISEWNFKGDPIRHVGPMAQDFYAAFGIGPDDKHIATVDADGVALAAIQGLNQKTENRSQKSEVRIQKLEAENAELRRQLRELQEIVNQLNRKENTP